MKIKRIAIKQENTSAEGENITYKKKVMTKLVLEFSFFKGLYNFIKRIF